MYQIINFQVLSKRLIYKIPTSISTCSNNAGIKLLLLPQQHSSSVRCLSSITTLLHNSTPYTSNDDILSQYPFSKKVSSLPRTLPSNTVRLFSGGSRRRIIRRRKGGTAVESSSSSTTESTKNNNDNTSTNSNVTMVKNKDKFLQEATAFLTRAVQALEPMKQYNDVFIITRSYNDGQGEKLTIGLAPGEGQYVLQVDNDLLTISLLSPMSGNYTYVLCALTNEFVGMEDNHKLEGMIVRDLIRHCNGLPKF